MSSSGGNAGIAVAYAGMQFGIPVTVFIPTSSHPIFLEVLKNLDATINIEGDVSDTAH